MRSVPTMRSRARAAAPATRRRVAVVINLPSPHRVAIFDRLAHFNSTVAVIDRISAAAAEPTLNRASRAPVGSRR
jgi:hypothetical protein